MSGLDFLDLVLQSSDSFILNAAFQFCFSFFSVYEVHVQLLPSWCCGSVVLFSLPRLEILLIFFSGLKSSPGFWLKAMFSEGPPFFVLFVGIYEALKLRLSVVALSESVTMSGPARTLLNLNMSRIHFLVPVSQVSDSFDLISLFFTFCLV